MWNVRLGILWCVELVGGINATGKTCRSQWARGRGSSSFRVWWLCCSPSAASSLQWRRDAEEAAAAEAAASAAEPRGRSRAPLLSARAATAARAPSGAGSRPRDPRWSPVGSSYTRGPGPSGPPAWRTAARPPTSPSPSPPASAAPAPCRLHLRAARRQHSNENENENGTNEERIKQKHVYNTDPNASLVRVVTSMYSTVLVYKLIKRHAHAARGLQRGVVHDALVVVVHLHWEHLLGHVLPDHDLRERRIELHNRWLKLSSTYRSLKSIEHYHYSQLITTYCTRLVHVVRVRVHACFGVRNRRGSWAKLALGGERVQPTPPDVDGGESKIECTWRLPPPPAPELCCPPPDDASFVASFRWPATASVYSMWWVTILLTNNIVFAR